MGMIPTTTKAEVKVFAGHGGPWLIGALLALMLAQGIGQQTVHAYFRIPFIGFALIMYLILQKKAPSNPDRTVWQGLLLWILFLRDVGWYAGIISYAYKERRDKEIALKKEQRQPQIRT